jgi:prepilin-type N-terminal cleavage/methylation domain-containing protein
MQARPGFTLYELLIALTLLGVLLSFALPAIRSTTDMLAARAARELAFAVFSRARAIALQHGGAEIELSGARDRITLRRASGAIEYEAHFTGQGVDLSLDGAADSAVLRYDAHGLGRMMSRTIRFTARRAQAGLTVSSFGRVRRW